MIIELNGKIICGSEYDEIYIGDECLVDYAEDIHDEMVTLRYYISNEPIKQETVVEDFLRSFYEGRTEIDGGYIWGSEWTGCYGKNDTFEVGEHDIIKELTSHVGKYCYLIVKTISKNDVANGS